MDSESGDKKLENENALKKRGNSEAGEKAVDEFLENKDTSASASQSEQVSQGKGEKKDKRLSIAAPLIGEFIGTFFLGAVIVFVHCSPGSGPDSVPLAAGLYVAVAIMTYGHVSGAHMNVAVSLAFAMMGHLKVGMFWGYFFVQTLGATLAGLMARFLLPKESYVNGSGAMTVPPAITSEGEEILINAIYTFLLITVVCHMIWDTAKPSVLTPIGVGLCITIIIYATKDIGCSVNPSIAMGMAIAASGTNFTTPTKKLEIGEAWLHVVYLSIGSLLGSALAVVLYRFVMTQNSGYLWPCCGCRKTAAKKDESPSRSDVEKSTNRAAKRRSNAGQDQM